MKASKLFRPYHEPEYSSPVWLGVSKSTNTTWLVLVGIVFLMFVLGILSFTGKLNDFLLFIFIVVIGLAIVGLVALSDVKVKMDSDGLVATCGAFGKPSRAIPWSQVKAVSAVSIKPKDWDGRGFRWRPSAKGLAIIMRTGPGLEIDLVDGKKFVVTVDKAIEGAEFANDRIA